MALYMKKKINYPVIILPDVMKNWLESPCMPIVPGPVLSANTLIKENAPLIMPKPRPETAREMMQLIYIC